MYDALYSPNLGLCGFRCRVDACTRVVRSYRGIVMHCKRVHGLAAQMKLFDKSIEEKADGEAKVGKQPELVRVESVYDAADGEQLFRNSNSSTYRDLSSES